MAESKKKAAKGKGAAKKSAAAKKGSRKAKPMKPEEAVASTMVSLAGSAPALALEVGSKMPFRGATSSARADVQADQADQAAGAQPVVASVTDPVRAPINRAVPMEVFTLDKQVRNPKTGDVLLVLRRPLGFPSGSLPGDPGAFSPLGQGRYGVCHVLAPNAAMRCAMWGRYG